MKKRASILVAWLFLLPAFGMEPVVTVADIFVVIREGLRKGRMEVDTPVGRYVHPPCNHDMKRDNPKDPLLGPSIKALNDESRIVIREWIGDEKPKWVAIIAPGKSPARDYIELCSYLRELGIGYTTFPVETIEGRKFARLRLIRGNFDNLIFTPTVIPLPMQQRPIEPESNSAYRELLNEFKKVLNAGTDKPVIEQKTGPQGEEINQTIMRPSLAGARGRIYPIDATFTAVSVSAL